MTDTFCKATVLGTFAIHSPEWHDARKLGGSDVFCLVETEAHLRDPDNIPPPTRGAFDVFMSASGMGEQLDSLAMRRGSFVEPFILAEAGRQRGTDIRPYKASLAHAKHPWATCNTDGIEWGAALQERCVCDVDDNCQGMYTCLCGAEEHDPRAVVEAKDWSAFQRREWLETGVPLKIQAQVQWQMAITGLPLALVAVDFHLSDELLIAEVKRDEEDIEALLDLGGRFWRDHVVPGVAPALDASVGCSEYLLRRYSETTDEVVEIDALEDFEGYDKAREDAKIAEVLKRRHRNALLGKLGDAKQGQCGGWKATRRVVKGNIQLWVKGQ